MGSYPNSIRHSNLLAIYLIIPLALAITGIDFCLFNGFLQRHLPRTPEIFLIYRLLFSFPHIVGSSTIFLDSAFLAYYRNRLLYGIPCIIFFALLLPRILGNTPFMALYLTLTAFHFAGQQFGLVQMMNRFKYSEFFYWRTLGFFFTTWVHYELFLAGTIFSSQKPFLIGLSAILLFIFLLLTHQLSRKSPSTVGRYYLWTNFLLVGVTQGFYLFGYPFFAVFVPQFIHNITAFYFYIVHDTNRNSEHPHNLIYLALNFSRIPIWMTCPLTAVMMAFPFTFLDFKAPGEWPFTLILIFTFIHYYTDTFTWKYPSLHRTYVAFR